MKLDKIIFNVSVVRKPYYFYRMTQLFLWEGLKHPYEYMCLADYIENDLLENINKYFWIKTKMVR